MTDAALCSWCGHPWPHPAICAGQIQTGTAKTPTPKPCPCNRNKEKTA